MGDNILKELKKEGNDFQGLKQNITIFNDLESELLGLLEEEPLKINSGNIETLYQLKRAWAL